MNQDSELVAAARAMCGYCHKHSTNGSAPVILVVSPYADKPLTLEAGELSAHAQVQVDAHVARLVAALHAIPRFDRLRPTIDFILEEPGNPVINIDFSDHFEWGGAMNDGPDLFKKLEERLRKIDAACPSGPLHTFTLRVAPSTLGGSFEGSFEICAATAKEARHILGSIRSKSKDVAEATQDVRGISMECPEESWALY